MNNNKQNMSPQEIRNLIIFMVVSVVLYFLYDTFMVKPYTQEMQAYKAQQASKQLATEQPGENAPSSPSQALLNALKDLPKAKDILSKTTNQRITFENDHVKGSIALQGGVIDSLLLKDYFETLEEKENIALLNPKGTAHPRQIELGWVSSDLSLTLPSKDSVWRANGNSTLTQESPVTLSWNNGQGLTFKRIYSLDDRYVLHIKQSVTNKSRKSVTLFPYGLIQQKGLPAGLENRTISHEGPIAYVGSELEDPDYKKMRKEGALEYTGSQGWIGLTEKYWLTALMPAQGQDATYRFHYTGTPPKKKQKDTGTFQTDFTASSISIAPGEEKAYESNAFIGPKKVIMLNEYSDKLGVEKLDLAVDFGMFWFFTIPFFYALHYLGLAIGNMGLAIIALTIIIRTMASPLTYSSYKSFAKMKKVMPQVKALKEQYGDNKENLQKEMLALYQKEGVNPAAGCLPILLQIPIFFAFYKILFLTIEIRHAPFFGWIQDLSAADPTTVFNLFGLIPWDPPSFLMFGAWPCMMLIAMQIQRKLNPPPTDPIQRDMAKWFPLMMTFIMSKFASGLVIYWTVSAFFGNVQQIIIMRKMGVPIHLFGETHDDEVTLIETKHHEEEDTAPEKPKAKQKAEPIKDIKPPKPKKKKKK